MKKLSKLLLLVLALSVCFTLLVACDSDPCKDGHTWVNGVCTVCEEEYDLVDYVSQLKFNENSGSAHYTNANILLRYVDGDTTHFNVPTTIDSEGVLKARYLAVNTPESTGKVEPYGKVASNFTHDTLQSALDNGGAIMVESDTTDGKWNHDSYNRYLVWVWYRPSADADWRNLNLELLQKGYAYGSNSGDNRYGDICIKALNQALDARLVVQSGELDETFHYGDAFELTLKELRTNLDEYNGHKVAFEGVVTLINGGNGCYVEDYDPDTGLVYGMYIYYGTVKTAKVLEILGTPGNRVRVVGTLSNQYGWQVSGVTYRNSKPNDPDNVQLIEKGHTAFYQKMTVSEFFGNTMIPVIDEETGEPVIDEQTGEVVKRSFRTCELVHGTTISMDELTVYKTSTTSNGGSNDGAITLYCRDKDGNEITVRTAVLYDADGNLVLASEFDGQKISVKGVVDYYSDYDLYQVKILRYTDIVIVG